MGRSTLVKKKLQMKKKILMETQEKKEIKKIEREKIKPIDSNENYVFNEKIDEV